MAYSTSNPPVSIIRAGIGNPFNVWFYRSLDALTTVRVTGYFSNADQLGINAGDVIYVQKSDTLATSIHVVMTVTALGACDLSDGTALTITNTD